MRNAYKILVDKPEGRKYFGYLAICRRDNIKIDLKEIGCDDVD
jgi:hypothetical protein